MRHLLAVVLAAAAAAADQTVATVRYAAEGINGGVTLGGHVQGSQDGSTWADLFIIGTATDYNWHYDLTPASPPGADLAVPGIPGRFRYLRFYGRDNSGCKIGELRFYDQAMGLLDGAHIGTAGSYLGLGNDLSKVFDGDPNTWFDAPSASGGWVGVDLGAAAADMPTVALTTPAGNATVTGSAAVLSATAAAGAGHSLAKVEFWRVTAVTAAAGGASTWSKIGEDAGSPYTATLSAAPGTYTVLAVAVDGDGNRTLSDPGTVTLTGGLDAIEFYAAPWSNLAGCRFQGNNTSAADGAPWVDIYTVPATAIATAGDGMYHAAVAPAAAYRYLRFRQVAPANGQIAGIRFLSGTIAATGTVFSDGATGAEAFDGAPLGTYFNDGTWTGLDLGDQGAALPTAPASLAATAGDASVALAWTAAAGPVAGYDVFRATAPGVPLGTPLNGGTPVVATTYTDAGLANGTTYYYVVRAIAAAGNGPASHEASATPAAAAGPGGDAATVNVDSSGTPACGSGALAGLLLAAAALAPALLSVGRGGPRRSRGRRPPGW